MPVNVKRLRKRLGLSRAALARILNVAPLTVQRWDNGQEPSGLSAAVLSAVDEAVSANAGADRVAKKLSLGVGALVYYGLVTKVAEVPTDREKRILVLLGKLHSHLGKRGRGCDADELIDEVMKEFERTGCPT